MGNNKVCSVAWKLGYLLHVRTVYQLINPSTALGLLSHWSVYRLFWLSDQDVRCSLDCSSFHIPTFNTYWRGRHWAGLAGSWKDVFGVDPACLRRCLTFLTALWPEKKEWGLCVSVLFPTHTHKSSSHISTGIIYRSKRDGLLALWSLCPLFSSGNLLMSSFVCTQESITGQKMMTECLH